MNWIACIWVRHWDAHAALAYLCLLQMDEALVGICHGSAVWTLGGPKEMVSDPVESKLGH